MTENTNPIPETLHLCVAGHRFDLICGLHHVEASLLSNYAPFRVDDASDAALFSVEMTTTPPALRDFTEEVVQDEEGNEIRVGHVDERPCFLFSLNDEPACALISDPAYRQATLHVVGSGLDRYSIDNALMVMFAMATAPLETALFHSSVVMHGGRGYMFLGKSGTGKSTHSRLWLDHLDDVSLLNDDNPVVRIWPDGRVIVYGSPWSGKTPCYRNLSVPVGAIVRLSQAPFNRIERMRPLMAFAALRPSISGKRWDKRLADGLHQTESTLAALVPVFHLDCLPDAAAARLCHATVAVACPADDSADHPAVGTAHRVMETNEALEEVAALLDEGRRVVLPVKGTSMLPFIVGGKESVELWHPSRLTPDVGHVVLAWVDGCRYVLHRIVKLDPEGHVVLMGDGNIRGVEHCLVGDIVGIAVRVVGQDGRSRDLYDRWHTLSARCWRLLLPLRRGLLFVYRHTHRL